MRFDSHSWQKNFLCEKAASGLQKVSGSTQVSLDALKKGEGHLGSSYTIKIDTSYPTI